MEIPPKRKLKVFTVTRSVEYLQNVYVLATSEEHAEELAEGFSENDWEDNDLNGNSQMDITDPIEVIPHDNKEFAKQAINAHWLEPRAKKEKEKEKSGVRESN